MGTLSERKEPRFNTATNVVIEVEGRGALQELWTANISRGGLFVVTRTPPPLQTKVSVTLETPDGTLVLEADVVHVVPPDDHSSAVVSGAGLQFTRISDAQRTQVQRYLDGLAAQLQAPMSDAGAAQLGQLMNTVRALLSGVEAGDVHAALQAPATASVADLHQRLDAVTAALKTIPAEASPAQQARIQSGQRALERIRTRMDTIVAQMRTQAPASAVAAARAAAASNATAAKPTGTVAAPAPPGGDDKKARMDAMIAGRAHAELGKQHMERQDFAAAEREYAAAVERDPNAVPYQVALAWAIAVSPSRTSADAAARAMEILEPLSKRYKQAEIAYTAGMVMHRAEKLPEAERYFQAALVIDKSHVGAARMVRLLESRRTREAAPDMSARGFLDMLKKK